MIEPPYAQPLRESAVQADPVAQFTAWFRAAQAADIRQPEAVAVATATAAGAPSVRMVLMKSYDENGFVFFTNYDSRKGAELTANPRAALLFHWEALGRQVRIEGGAAPVTREESERYVRSRPPASQISALASPQSRVIDSRETLESRVAELAERYRDSDPPIPERWGGFRVAPELFEFWQHREDRLHDRLLYTRDAPGGTWRIQRLAP
jgi:pyridoxamine 5'-phosphate oxidase